MAFGNDRNVDGVLLIDRGLRAFRHQPAH